MTPRLRLCFAIALMFLLGCCQDVIYTQAQTVLFRKNVLIKGCSIAWAGNLTRKIART